MKKLGNLLDLFCAIVSGLTMVGMIVVNFADSIGRQIGHPVLGAQEYVQFLLLAFFFSSIPILVRENAHIRVGLVTDAFKGVLAKAEKIWTFLFEFGSTVLLVYLVYLFASRADRIGTLSSHHMVPIAPFLYTATAIACLAIFFVIERHVDHLPDRRSKAEREAHHLVDDKDLEDDK